MSRINAPTPARTESESSVRSTLRVTLLQRIVDKVRLESLRKSSTRAALRLPPAASTSRRNLLTLKIARLSPEKMADCVIQNAIPIQVNKSLGNGAWVMSSNRAASGISATLWRKATKEPLFHSFHCQQVEDQHAYEDKEEKGRRRDETEMHARGVNGSSAATATTVSEQAISHGLGRLLKGFLRVRMMKMTSTCVAMDSMNQPVWKSASPAWKTASMM